jgi:hypothetical protein
VFVEQEAIVLPPFVAIAVRPRPGVWEFVRVNVNELNVEQLGVSEYLRFKEELVDGQYVLSAPVPAFSALTIAHFASVYGESFGERRLIGDLGARLVFGFERPPYRT